MVSNVCDRTTVNTYPRYSMQNGEFSASLASDNTDTL